MKWLLIAAFAATIPAANWMIGNVGECIPNGPCVVPVWPGIYAPSGVMMIGVALVLRDLVQRSFGLWPAVAAILAGAVLSTAVAPPALAVASGAAFLLSEMADLAVYTPLYRRRLALAVIASGIVGAMVDSALFLWLAFGSLEHLEGQVIGKLYASALFAGWLVWRRPPRFMGAGHERRFKEDTTRKSRDLAAPASRIHQPLRRPVQSCK